MAEEGAAEVLWLRPHPLADMAPSLRDCREPGARESHRKPPENQICGMPASVYYRVQAREVIRHHHRMTWISMVCTSVLVGGGAMVWRSESALYDRLKAVEALVLMGAVIWVMLWSASWSRIDWPSAAEQGG